MNVRVIALFVSTALVAAGFGQNQDPPAAAPATQLRAELTVNHRLFTPSMPARIRFTLFNPTNQTVECSVPSSSEDTGVVALPHALIFGTAEQPSLFIHDDRGRVTPIRPETAPTETASGVLRLAPRSSIGSEADLPALDRLFRYSGKYRLEWRPFGETAQPASVEFRIEARKDAVLSTDYGKITFSLNYDQAPRNVENFLELARDRFYDGKTIHRLIPGFIIQGGSPDGSRKGIRPDGKLVAAEFNDTPFQLGTLAMARKPNDPDSASCQFFISLGRLKELDGKYTVIGQAQDEESVRTLRRLSELPADEKTGRPIRPLKIISFSLINARSSTARTINLKPTTTP